MNLSVKNIFFSVLLLANCLLIKAQEELQNMVINQTLPTESRLKAGSIDSYWLTVTYDKTTHIIFPSKIKYVDLGSEFLIAEKAEETENVLRIKAAKRDFEPETNFTVITEDGQFYNFDVLYSHYPAYLNYDILKMSQHEGREKIKNVLFEDLGETQPFLIESALRAIYTKNDRQIRHIRSKKFGISFQLKGIYTGNGKYFFHTELENTSAVSFPIDFMTFKVIDKRKARRTVIQETELIPLKTYFPLHNIGHNRTESNVFLFDQFTLDDDKILVIEIFEKNGGRHQKIEVKNSDLIRARQLTDLKLVF